MSDLTLQQQRRIDLELLDRRAKEQYGLAADHAARKDIRHIIDGGWKPALHRKVLRALSILDERRARLHLVSDKIPPNDCLPGDLALGDVISLEQRKTQLRLASRRLLLGTLITGLIGSGKTMLTRLLIRLIIETNPDVRMLIFDPNKSYAEACSDASEWVSVGWSDVKLNPFCWLDLYDPRRWLNEKLDQLVRGELLHSRYLVIKRLDSLVDKFAKVGSFPSLPDLARNLAAIRCRPGSPDDRYRMSSLNVIDGRCRTTGDVYDCSIGMERLLVDTRCCIDLAGLTPIQSREFFIGHLIHYAHARRTLEPVVEPPELHTLIVVEEAQALIAPRSESVPFYHELLLRSRALGIGFLFICQDLSSIDPTIASVMGNLFAFTQASKESKFAAQRLLDLDPRETALLSALPVGHCFIRFAGHESWPFPFIGRIGERR